jgi:hypothetical protein
MSVVDLDPKAVRLELTAAELLLRNLPREPSLARPHLDRAADYLSIPRETEHQDDVRSAWRRLSDLGAALHRAEQPTAPTRRRLGRFLLLALAVLLIIGASVLVKTPRITDTREVGKGDVIGDLDGDGSYTVSIEGGRRLLVQLGSAWHEDSIGIGLRHQGPCRIVVMRRGRPLWRTTLRADDAPTGDTYDLALSERARRRGFDQILITPDPSDATIRVGELRLGSP